MVVITGAKSVPVGITGWAKILGKKGEGWKGRGRGHRLDVGFFSSIATKGWVVKKGPRRKVFPIRLFPVTWKVHARTRPARS